MSERTPAASEKPGRPKAIEDIRSEIASASDRIDRTIGTKEGDPAKRWISAFNGVLNPVIGNLSIAHLEGDLSEDQVKAAQAKGDALTRRLGEIQSQPDTLTDEVKAELLRELRSILD